MKPNSTGNKVPHWAKYWAVDKSGGSAFFSHEPDLEGGIWIKTKGKYQTDGYVHTNGDEYKDSLLQIKQAKEMSKKKIAAHVFNGAYWSGWSTKYGVVFSIRHAAILVSRDPELGFYIIDGNKKTAYVSDAKFRKKAADTAKLFFVVSLNWFVTGYPKSKKCSEIIKRKKQTK